MVALDIRTLQYSSTFLDNAIGIQWKDTMRKLFCIALAMPLVWASTALSASFNCQPYLRQNKCPEVEICLNNFLSSQDDYMAVLFFKLRDELRGDLVIQFRNYQREWLAKRDACGCSYDCLVDAYDEQIGALTTTLKQMGR